MNGAVIYTVTHARNLGAILIPSLLPTLYSIHHEVLLFSSEIAPYMAPLALSLLPPLIGILHAITGVIFLKVIY